MTAKAVVRVNNWKLLAQLAVVATSLGSGQPGAASDCAAAVGGPPVATAARNADHTNED